MDIRSVVSRDLRWKEITNYRRVLGTFLSDGNAWNLNYVGDYMIIQFNKIQWIIYTKKGDIIWKLYSNYTPINLTLKEWKKSTSTPKYRIYTKKSQFKYKIMIGKKYENYIQCKTKHKTATMAILISEESRISWKTV